MPRLGTGTAIGYDEFDTAIRALPVSRSWRWPGTVPGRLRDDRMKQDLRLKQPGSADTRPGNPVTQDSWTAIQENGRRLAVDDNRENQALRIPRRGFRAGFRACGLCLVVGGPILILAVAYASYGAPIVDDLSIVYLFVLLPLGFSLVGFSVAHRWLRGAIALGYLATYWLTFALLDALLPTGEPRSAVHWYGVIYGPQFAPVAFVITLTLGLIFVPQHPKPGHCRKCGYNLRGLPEPRCPECGTRFNEARLHECHAGPHEPTGG